MLGYVKEKLEDVQKNAEKVAVLHERKRMTLKEVARQYDSRFHCDKSKKMKE